MIKYDPAIHIHLDDMSILTGLPEQELRNLMRRDKDSPKRVGVAMPKRVKVVIYDRAEILKWLDKLPKPERGELVRPSEFNLMTRPPYKPSPEMLRAYERSERQPRLISMTSVAKHNVLIGDR